MTSSPKPGQIDIRKLPLWLQYLIALTVIAVVVAAAWFVGRDNPVPDWITRYLIPILGWAYIVLFAFVVAMKLFKKL